MLSPVPVPVPECIRPSVWDLVLVLVLVSVLALVLGHGVVSTLKVGTVLSAL